MTCTCTREFSLVQAKAVLLVLVLVVLVLVELLAVLMLIVLPPTSTTGGVIAIIEWEEVIKEGYPTNSFIFTHCD